MRPGPGPPRCVHLLGDTHDAGAENQARYLLDGLRAKGEFAPELIYFGAGRAHAQFEALGIPMLHVPRLRRFRFDALGRARRIRRAYAERPPDLLHTWMLEGNVVGLLAARTWPRTRVVITQRGSWNELDYTALAWFQRLLIRRADYAISNSRGGAEMLKRQGLPGERIEVIPNGIPENRVALRDDVATVRGRQGWEDAHVIAWVGRVNDAASAAQKDFATLLGAVEALRRVRPSAHLALIGPTRAEIERNGFALPAWAQPLGWVEHPADLVNAADLLAISSRFEGNSNAAGEALLLGRPVVTTDCGDHCELVRLTGGRVVAPGDAAGLAREMELLLDQPPECSYIQQIAKEALSVGRMVDRTIDVYRKVVG